MPLQTPKVFQNAPNIFRPTKSQIYSKMAICLTGIPTKIVPQNFGRENIITRPHIAAENIPPCLGQKKKTHIEKYESIGGKKNHKKLPFEGLY